MPSNVLHLNIFVREGISQIIPVSVQLLQRDTDRLCQQCLQMCYTETFEVRQTTGCLRYKNENFPFSVASALQSTVHKALNYTVYSLFQLGCSVVLTQPVSISLQ